MQITISEEKKNRLVFFIEGDSHTFANALRISLNEDDHVKVAGYHIDHPLVGKPKFVIETDGADPRKTVLSAIKRLEKTFDKFEEDVKKQIKVQL